MVRLDCAGKRVMMNGYEYQTWTQYWLFRRPSVQAFQRHDDGWGERQCANQRDVLEKY